jgi:hypothetical protein
MERLVQSNSWPYVQISFSNLNVDGTPHVHLDVANKGVGPARLESLQAIYNGTRIDGARPLLNALLNRMTVSLHSRLQTSDVVHTVLAAKELVSFVDFKPEDFTPEDYAAIARGVPKIDFLACYCSVFDECWMADTTKTRPTKIKKCPASSSKY